MYLTVQPTTMPMATSNPTGHTSESYPNQNAFHIDTADHPRRLHCSFSLHKLKILYSKSSVFTRITFSGRAGKY